jgi:hypothetical protein
VAGPQLLPGARVTGTITAHCPWGLEVLLDDQTAVTVDLRFIDDDALVWGDPGRWPVPGTRIAGRIQGTMPNGQLRVTLRLSDQA